MFLSSPRGFIIDAMTVSHEIGALIFSMLGRAGSGSPHYLGSSRSPSAVLPPRVREVHQRVVGLPAKGTFRSNDHNSLATAHIRAESVQTAPFSIYAQPRLGRPIALTINTIRWPSIRPVLYWSVGLVSAAAAAARPASRGVPATPRGLGGWRALSSRLGPATTSPC